MSTIIQITDHVQQMKDLLLEQFKNSRVIQNVDNTTLDFILQSYGIQIQELEDELILLCTQRYLANAEEVQLDGIGSIVGEPSNGRTDDEYRIAIRVKTLLNRSDGTVEQIVEIMDLASGELPTTGHYVNITEEYPACIIASTIEPITTEPRIMKSTLGKARLGGVCDFFVYHTDTDANTYKFSSTLGAEGSSSTQGMASVPFNSGIITFSPSAGNDGQLAPVFNTTRLDDTFQTTGSGGYCWVVDSSTTPGLYSSPGTLGNVVLMTPVLPAFSNQSTVMSGVYSSPDKLTYFAGDMQFNLLIVDPVDDSLTLGGLLPAGHISALACDQTTGTLYLGGVDGFFFSINSGATWTSVAIGSGSKDTHIAWIEGRNQILITHDFSIYRTSALTPTIPGLLYSDPLQREIFKIFADRKDVMIGGTDGLVAFSKNFGDSWHNRMNKSVGTFGAFGEFTSVVFSPNPVNAVHTYLASDDTLGTDGVSISGGWGAFDDSFDRVPFGFQPIHDFAVNSPTGFVMALASNVDISTGFFPTGGHMKGVL